MFESSTGTATLDRRPMFPAEASTAPLPRRPRNDDERPSCSIADQVVPARGQE